MPRPRSCPHLLLVEDSDDDAFFFERILRKSGLPYALTRQDNGTAALSFLTQCARAGDDSSNCPDLIFLDLKLPGASGFEILQWLSVNKLPRPYKVAVLSGSDQPVDLARAASLGASDYLVKPLHLEQLQSRLQSWAAASPTAQPSASVSGNLQP
jgi:CheY-like chemotaxis protein